MGSLTWVYSPHCVYIGFVRFYWKRFLHIFLSAECSHGMWYILKCFLAKRSIHTIWMHYHIDMHKYYGLYGGCSWFYGNFTEQTKKLLFSISLTMSLWCGLCFIDSMWIFYSRSLSIYDMKILIRSIFIVFSSLSQNSRHKINSIFITTVSR